MLDPAVWNRLSRLLGAPREHTATVDRILHAWDENDEEAPVVSLTRGGWLQIRAHGEVRTLPPEVWLELARTAEPAAHTEVQRAAHTKKE